MESTLSYEELEILFSEIDSEYIPNEFIDLVIIITNSGHQYSINAKEYKEIIAQEKQNGSDNIKETLMNIKLDSVIDTVEQESSLILSKLP